MHQDQIQAVGEQRQECDDEACAQVRAERDMLLASIRDLTHAQLISRDTELGLRAELMQAKIDIDHVRARGAHELALVRMSTTWKVGRWVLAPIAASRRLLLRGIKKHR